MNRQWKIEQMASTKEVLDHHLKCFDEDELKGIFSDYAAGAVLFPPDGPLWGADAMRPLFWAMIGKFGNTCKLAIVTRESQPQCHKDRLAVHDRQRPD
jgi:hypothetical protein